MDMVERVARAIRLAQAKPHTDDEVARAAIEAMREPTEAMIDAGTASLHGYGVEQRTIDAYTAMIDAALQKDPG